MPSEFTGSCRIDPMTYRDELPRAIQRCAVIELAPGIYPDVSLEIDRPIKMIGCPGQTILHAVGLVSNGKAMLLIAADTVLQHITFTGAIAFNGNGGGIRHEAGRLTVEHCIFRRNQNSILSAASTEATVTIRNSVFIENGAEDGHAHGLYVTGPIACLSVERSIFIGTNTGHHLKSRARETKIVDCRFGDGVSGSASYAVDIPNGGCASLCGNTFLKSPHDSHFAFINYGGEGSRYENNQLVVQRNAFRGRSFPPTVVLLMRQRADRLIWEHNRIERALLARAGWHGLRLASGLFQ